MLATIERNEEKLLSHLKTWRAFAMAIEEGANEKEIYERINQFMNGSECQHNHKIVVYQIVGEINPHRVYKYQCSNCYHLSSSVKYADLGEIEKINAMPEVRLDWSYVNEQRRTIKIGIIDIWKNRKDSSWWNQYQVYLQSPQWAAKRRLVLNRAHNTCEGCGMQPATQVHHLTYDHVFQEFLFELVAVCDGCHTKITPSRPAPNGQRPAPAGQRGER